ncbi:1,4-alpha-glucan branching protein GlgB [Corynebacterium sp. sy039]|uniref:1,4-alpha-glucan branching protein GlgB n=1 Tax=Corynebacterium sp. sy039 TaxID=2599641 RepID=UPI0011B667E2|nr:1,4-alpha-glucan branching protein GlgB [Corynebacterium sp. sy039]
MSTFSSLQLHHHDEYSLLTHACTDPHAIYGLHTLDASHSRFLTRCIGAQKVELHCGQRSFPLEKLDHDFFGAIVAQPADSDYRLHITWASGLVAECADPYSFSPTLGELDLHLIGEGRHERLWEVLGAHVREYTTELGQVSGTSFAVWAPHAAGVAVIGDFNGWNPDQHPMRLLGDSGVWEIFIPTVSAGAVYKYAIYTADGTRLDKADPLAQLAQKPPETASIVSGTNYQWQDAAWLEQRKHYCADNAPMSIYEVHLGSWKQGRSYHDLATELVDYVHTMGYTHVEFLPVAQHPFGGSWGYQVSGYYAPYSAWGSPNELKALIDAFHNAGIGVIMDWVPAHFPKDSFALGRFDGQALYEHPDWRRGEQKDWGTFVFNYGLNHVRNFLIANALYWCEEFHIDGLRVDAVASMLYLDYSRGENEWLPNEYGGREHIEAVQFLQELNATVHKHHRGVLTIAEESTSWPGVTSPTTQGGLGFSMKWNMGWMNDTLAYFQEDPIHRQYHHNKITFSLVYAYSEKFILPFSHDEVVHGKGSLWRKIPGDKWNKAAGLRALLTYMYAHPGKKLLFQGQEFGQEREWAHDRSLDWEDINQEDHYHAGISRLTHDLNMLYRRSPELFSLDNEESGFSWVKADEAQHNILAFIRYSATGEKMLCVFNFSGVSHTHYRLGVPEAGTWECVFNSDAGIYQGANNLLPSTVCSGKEWDNYPYSVNLHIPAMSAQLYRWAG